MTWDKFKKQKTKINIELITFHQYYITVTQHSIHMVLQKPFLLFELQCFILNNQL